MGSQFMVRGVDFIVAIALLRLLGPSGNGEYALAVVIWLYVKTISDFGLGLLAAREIAKDHQRFGNIIGATTIFRWVVLAITLLPVGAYSVVRLNGTNFSDQNAIAIALLFVSIVPSSYSEAINSGFNGLERMDLAAWINGGVSMIRAPLAILLGATSLAVSGVALAALLTAIFSAIVFHRTMRSIHQSPVKWSLDMSTARYYASESWPLLINALLISLFFRIDVFVIDAIDGSAELGVYDASYKLINLLTIIPAYATLAVFPMMVKHAGNIDSLIRAQRVTTYVLVTAAWVIVVLTLATANLAIRILAGELYLPEAATLLRVLIWFAPLSFMNGVFQYVLIATGNQRKIVPAFVLALSFNFVLNLIFVPVYGAMASATLTVMTEIVIFVAFAVISRLEVVKIHNREVFVRLWRPTLAGLIASGIALYFRDQLIVSVVTSMITFLALALLLRVVTEEEMDIFRRIFSRSARTPAI